MKNQEKKKKELDIIQNKLEEQAELEGLLENTDNPKKRKSKNDKNKEIDNKEYIHITYLFVFIFLALICYVVYFSIVKSKTIINNPYNIRLDYMEEQVVRGSILDDEGNVLAKTEVDEDGNEERIYPYGKLYAHAIGYNVNGMSGLELSENYELLTSDVFFTERFLNQMKDKKNVGNTVVTTLNTDLQQAAYDALGDQNGAIIVMEVNTGKILTMVSKPTFNPNTVEKSWNKLVKHEDSVLLNRATQGAYAPGSTFKIVTTLTYIRENPQYKTYTYDCKGKIKKEDAVLHCAGNVKHGEESLEESFAYSCNTSFANIGLSINKKSLNKTAKDLLFNEKLPAVLSESECKKSVFEVNNKTNDADLMMTVIGQGKTMVSPYHLALITCAIANGGVLMKPYMVDEIQTYKGASVKKYKPTRYKTLISLNEASQLKEYMCSVVEYGTGTALKDKKYKVAGKTGTAEYSTTDKDKVHSWFIGFTNPKDPEIAISVVIEGADTSGKKAITVAERVFEAYY